MRDALLNLQWPQGRRAVIPTESKRCAGRWGCGEYRWIEEFRLLSSGQRAAYCADCERRFDCWRRHGRHPDLIEIPSGLLPGGVASPSAEDIAAGVCLRLVAIEAVDEGLLALSEELISLLEE